MESPYVCAQKIPVHKLYFECFTGGGEKVVFLLKVGCVDPEFTKEAKSTVKVEKQQSMPSSRSLRVHQVDRIL